jgi:hypothetical protein
VEIRSCLVGLLEPLLIGFATMQQHFAQKIDLSEVLYQITSRYFFCWIAVVTFQCASELLPSWHLALMQCHVVVYVLCYHFELSIDVFSHSSILLDAHALTIYVLIHYRFDSLRVTPKSLDILSKGPPVCGDLAVSLSQAGPQFTQVSLVSALFCIILFSSLS